MGLSGAKWDQHYIPKNFFFNFKSDLYVIFPFNFFAKSNRFCIVLVLIRGQNRSNTQNVELLF